MSISKRIGVSLSIALAGALYLSAAKPASALLVYDAVTNDGNAGSSATFTHDPDLNVPGIPAITTNNTLPSFKYSGTLTPAADPKTFVPNTAFPTPPSYQFKTTEAKAGNGGSSVATASVAEVNNATSVGVKLQAGTGVTQANPANAYSGPSSIKIGVDLFFDANSAGFGPGGSGIATFNVGGTVGAAAGSFAKFTVLLDYFNETTPGFVSAVDPDVFSAGPPTLRSEINTTKTFQRVAGSNGTDGNANASTGAFSFSFVDSQLFNGTGQIAPFTRVHITGFIEFQARNGGVTTGFSPFGENEVCDATTVGFTTEAGVGGTLGPTFDFSATPEPASMLLSAFGIGAAGLSLLRRRREN